jgi:GTP-binding protein LepA
MDLSHIRNFSIIAHIDHGKSTLADRMLEITGTIDARNMTDQVLDNMELEKERGITIKMQPVRMKHTVDGVEYMYHLIDTPGHIDFSYEVSRALKAVEGSLLLVDSTQGIQAQTLSVLQMARESGLAIIPVLTKVDAPAARPDDITLEVCELLGCEIEDVLLVSGKTGSGVRELLDAVVARIPAPVSTTNDARALVFDYEYSNHQGIIVYVRVMDGTVKAGDTLEMRGAHARFTTSEVGSFLPKRKSDAKLSAGEIGYIVTGIKDAAIAVVGDTVAKTSSSVETLAGYKKADPMIWASLFPESQDEFLPLRSSLARLHLSDSAFHYEEESSGILGRGFRCGFLGMLHLEIITERLRREFDQELVVTAPTVVYQVTKKNKEVVDVYAPHQFPSHGDVESVREPWAQVTLVIPRDYLSNAIQLMHQFEADVVDTINHHTRNSTELVSHMPLRELMRNFFDAVKSATSGYGSLSYELIGYRDADVERLDILVNNEAVPAFTRVCSTTRIQLDAEELTAHLKELLPAQLVNIKIQAESRGRIIASETIKAMRKDVTDYLYGGDITRRKKLWEKQKKGKKKMQMLANIEIPSDVFLKVVQGKKD